MGDIPGMIAPEANVLFPICKPVKQENVIYSQNTMLGQVQDPSYIYSYLKMRQWEGIYGSDPKPSMLITLDFKVCV